MAMLSVPLSYWFTATYRKWPDTTIDLKIKDNLRLSDEDTYYVIVGPTQQQYIPLLEADPRFKILYKSPKAVNWNYSTDGPRNTLYILEKADASEAVQS